MKSIKFFLKSVLIHTLPITLLAMMSACDTTDNRRDNASKELAEAEKKLEKAGDKIGKGLEDAGEKLGEATKDAGNKLEQSKDKFVTSTRDEIRELDERIDKLKDRINSSAKNAKRETTEESREARGNMQDELKDLELKRNNLDKQLEKLENASQSVWQDMKKGISDAVSDIKEATNKVEERVEKESNN
jgi:chromosome segregation ATPase